MSKNNNVNPNFYQTAGREHTDGPDNGDPREDQKQKMNEGQAKVSGKADHPAVMRAKKK